MHVSFDNRAQSLNLEHQQCKQDAGLGVCCVRICSCVILVTFTVYVCSVNVRSCLNCVTIVVVDCSCDALLRSTAATKGSL